VSYVLPKDYQGYDAGTELRDVTLQEARAMECNRCGGCCSGLLPDDVVTKDPNFGMPLMTWGAKYPADRYKERYGTEMLLPVVRKDGGIGIGEAFEVMDNGQEYTCYTCTFFSQDGEGKALCGLREQYGDGDPQKLETLRPLNCGEFPVFSTAVDDALVGGHSFVPATGALPACTWHGIRVTGPWKDTPYYRDRWEAQQRGEPVADLSLPEDVVQGLENRAAKRRALKKAGKALAGRMGGTGNA
jgi:hypothetical protein